MPYIADSFEHARTDGSYSLLFGDRKLGALMSAVHATSIKMGNELEQLIIERAKVIDEQNINQFFEKTLPDGIWIIPKRVIGIDKRLNFDPKPDMILVITQKNTAKVIEMKLGDNFDTKKAQGEVDVLKRYTEKLDKATTYKVSYAVCMFYAKSKSAVVVGFKNKITEKEALTGREFCEIVSIDFEEINKVISEKQEMNRKFFFMQISEIMQSIIK